MGVWIHTLLSDTMHMVHLYLKGTLTRIKNIHADEHSIQKMLISMQSTLPLGGWWATSRWKLTQKSHRVLKNQFGCRWFKITHASFGFAHFIAPVNRHLHAAPCLGHASIKLQPFIAGICQSAIKIRIPPFIEPATWPRPKFCQEQIRVFCRWVHATVG